MASDALPWAGSAATIYSSSGSKRDGMTAIITRTTGNAKAANIRTFMSRKDCIRALSVQRI
jgi:hypothetical protein